jgi:hypothetical protein
MSVRIPLGCKKEISKGKGGAGGRPGPWRARGTNPHKFKDSGGFGRRSPPNSLRCSVPPGIVCGSVLAPPPLPQRSEVGPEQSQIMLLLLFRCLFRRIWCRFGCVFVVVGVGFQQRKVQRRRETSVKGSFGEPAAVGGENCKHSDRHAGYRRSG